MINYIFGLIAFFYFSLFIIPVTRKLSDDRIKYYKDLIKIQKHYNENTLLEDANYEKVNDLLSKIEKCCYFKHNVKKVVGIAGILFSVIYLFFQVIQIKLFGNFNPVN